MRAGSTSNPNPAAQVGGLACRRPPTPLCGAYTQPVPRLLSFVLALVLAFAISSAGVAAQSPQVLELYNQARAAQQAGHEDQAIAAYQKMLALDPDLAQGWNNLGRLFYNAGRYADAETALTRGLALNPAMIPAQILLGASLLELDRPQEAVAPLQSGVAASPDDRFARERLAQALLATGQLPSAQAQLESLVQSDPRDQEAWYLLGKLHLQLSQEALTKAQSLNPDSPLAHILAGEVMESMQNNPGAVAEYKNAIRTAPSDKSAPKHLANLYWQTGDWAQARDSYRLMLAGSPSDCVAHFRLAHALDELGEEPESAMREVTSALDRCPNLAQAHAERARLQLRSGHPSQALADLQAAQQAAPDESSVQQLLAQAYRALGDKAKAQQAEQRFHQLEGEQHAAKERHAAEVVHANP